MFLALASVNIFGIPRAAYARTATDISLRDKLRGSIENMGLSVRSGDPYEIIGFILKSLFGLLGVIFFLLMIYAGFLWMTSRGNESKIEKAKSILTASIIGILIVFTSYIVTVFTVSILRPT